MDKLRAVLAQMKEDVRAYEAVLHELPTSEDFLDTSSSFQTTLLERAYRLKSMLIDIDQAVVSILGDLQ